MEESKAISPETKGLFDTIRAQAKEYAEAFDFLKREKEELMRLKSLLYDTQSEISAKAGDLFNEIHKNVIETLSLIESKTEKTIKIYDELENIRTLRDSLYSLSESLKKQAVELQSTNQMFKSRADIEIESTILEIRSKAEKEIESQIQKMELRLALKLKNIESKILNFDQKLLSISDFQGREYRTLLEEIESCKLKAGQTRLAFDDYKMALENHLKDIEFAINSRVDNLDMIVTSKYKTKKDESSKTIILENITSDEKTELENEINKLKEQIRKLNIPPPTQNNPQTIVKAAIAIAAMAAVLAIAALLI
jgi:hypothetical protein